MLDIPASFDQRWSERLTDIVLVKFERPPRLALVFHLQNCAFESKLKVWPRITATSKESKLFVEPEHTFSYAQYMRAVQRLAIGSLELSKRFSDFYDVSLLKIAKLMDLLAFPSLNFLKRLHKLRQKL